MFRKQVKGKAENLFRVGKNLSTMNKRLHIHMWLTVLLLCLVSKAGAQTTVTTGLPSSASSGSGAQYFLTFIVENTNGYGIVINSMDMYRGSGSNGNTRISGW